MKRLDLFSHLRSFFLLLLCLNLSACTWNLSDISTFVSTVEPDNSTATQVGATQTPVPMAEITFSVTIPVPLNNGESLVIGILDEVTGLGLNPVMYQMVPADGNRYTITLPFVLNSLVKYRYYRQGSIPATEVSALGGPIRYRMFNVTGPAQVLDLVSAWPDLAFNGGFGKISGIVTDTDTGQPLTGIMVNAGGVSTLSDSSGAYSLDGLPVGQHLLTASAQDGKYQVFQQGAVVGTGMVTNALIHLKNRLLVEVTFSVNIPSDTVEGAPIRLAGNLIDTGNSFADLRSGISTVADQMPVLKKGADGKYSVTLKLPSGSDFRYKYTLGDGFWNAEHSIDGNFVVRQLIVPQESLVINDSVTGWLAGKQSAPIVFDLSVPPETPQSEIIYIQFNPFGWTEPLPMWPLGNNHWTYKLYSPLNMLGSFQYRYCRNGQCGAADDSETAGPDAKGRIVNTSLVTQNIQDTVKSWQWFQSSTGGAVPSDSVNIRKGIFWAGVEFSPAQSPIELNYLSPGIENALGIGANYVVLTPTWTISHVSPLVFDQLSGRDAMWNDTLQAVQAVRAKNLNVALYPRPVIPGKMDDFWAAAAKTPEWWDDWFSRYRAFLLYNADLATQSGAQALIIGGPEVLPALPVARLSDGTPSNVPQDAEARWRDILKEVHQHFPGMLLWAHPYSHEGISEAPAFIDQFYAVYLLWSAPIADSTESTVDEMANNAITRLDQDIVPFLLSIEKGVVLAIDYPSAEGASQGCVRRTEGECLEWSRLSRPTPDVPEVQVDLSGQANAYRAMLLAVNQRDWVGGLVSRDYYAPVPLLDKSSSIHGKPAADLLWYWFPRMLSAEK